MRHNGYSTDTEIHSTNLRHPCTFRRMGSCGPTGSGYSLHENDYPVRASTLAHANNTEPVDCVTPPLRLQSIQMLMQRLNPEDRVSAATNEGVELSDINGGSSALPFRNYTHRSAYPDPPPASTDSGHPASSGSNYDIRESPSLFSDAFKLDLSN